ncbi:unnamed protein product [Symbiodinium microadriaticum]|nr:unnamed protein product [Symbiodinium microadriaticum]
MLANTAPLTGWMIVYWFADTVSPFSVEKALGEENKSGSECSRLEVTVESLTLQDTKKPVPVYVELCARPPPGGSRRAKGIESTIFKTDAVEGICIAYQSKIVLSPLHSSDGFLSVRVLEKTTFGDDVLIGERNDLQVSSFCSADGERLVCSCGDAEVILRAVYRVSE